ncbi:autotransporter assembly complex protein TamB [Pseudoalteromonas ruthenica]|uniref:Translocation and assembly module TamB C-terminal domain-containing protein n=1 Tax=Pseudoalteromonas ruthenica TaxID=151081 RepID=A0A0F4PPG2_9GAMM|nr:translocation/assembly module TamB domain-containing protein [Pseudoalteromonas ruthenica]KJY95277.1 hypothetical protein TW76_15925 [Pseudoalteromonas ruthenica]KJY96131.1 hypothetical protein TW72_17430 [Pseudoalteromonas ruthenica]TMO86498.1 DUF490 domain-containing protein [Pseudoalteromonas ruthenica]TMO91177.1 DUF490 domain-containing protein [Pseudoalteromonas ruthenica]TMP01798.1 DUF490 domain-containing protein [Pseudoalteromonas ruthenica]
MSKGYKRILRWCGGLVGTILVTLFCLLFTEVGNKGITYVANHSVDGLRISLKEGRFLYDDPFDISFTSEQISIDAEAVRIDWQLLGCAGLCFRQVGAESLTVQVADQQNDKAAATDLQPPASEPISLPTITIKSLFLGQANIHAAGLSVSARDFKSALEAHQRDVKVQPLRLRSLELTLPESEQQPSSAPLEALPPLPPIAFDLGINAQLKSAQVADIIITQGQQSHRISDLKVAVALQQQQLSVSQLSAAYQLPADIATNEGDTLEAQAQGQFSFADGNPLTLSLQLAALGERSELSFTGSLDELNVQARNQGKYTFELDAQAQLRQQNWPFELAFSHAPWQLEVQGQPLQVERTNINALGTLDNYRLDVDALTQLAAYPQVSTSLQAQGSLSGINAAPLQLRANDSHVEVTTSIAWRDGISADFSAQLTNLHSEYLLDTVRSDLSGQLQGRVSVESPQQWWVELKPSSLSGTINEQPLTFNAELNIDSDLSGDIHAFSVRQGENTLVINGRIDEQWQLAGELNLSSSSPLYQGYSGQGYAQFSIEGQRLSPKLQLQLQLATLQGEGLRVSDATLDITGQYQQADLEYDLDAEVTNVSLDGQVIKGIQVQSQGSQHHQQNHIRAGLAQGQAQLAFQSELQQQQLSLAITELELRGDEYQVALEQSTELDIDLAQQSVRTKPFCLKGNAMHLCIEPSDISAKQGYVNAKLDYFHLQSLTTLLGPNLGIEGQAQGHAQLAWQDNQAMQIDAEFHTQQLQGLYRNQGQLQRLPVETLMIKLSSDAKNANAKLSIDSSVVGSIDADLAVEDITQAQQLSGEVHLTDTDISKFAHFVPDVRKLAGRLSANLTLSGTLAQPYLNGELKAHELAIEGDALPVALANSRLEAELDGESMTLEGELLTPDGGKLAIDGSGVWLSDNPALTISLSGERFMVVPQQGVNVAISPDLTIDISAQSVQVDGRVDVPYGRIKIKELPKGAVQVSDDEIIVDAPQKQQSAPFAYQVQLDVGVHDDVYIDSFGLKSYIMGDLKLTASNESPPLASGELKLVDGKYRAFGQDLVIRTGQIGFSGALDKPYLNVRAIRNPDTTANGVIAGIELIGNVEQPKLNVFSEPAMDRSQALSYVLNGQPLGDGDTNTDAMLTQILLAQGLNRSEGFVSRVGETFGLSDITLNSKGSGDDTKVEIAGYIAPGIQVKYSVGVFESISEVAVRYQILQKLYIEVTSGLYDTLDILYRFDVD